MIPTLPLTLFTNVVSLCYSFYRVRRGYNIVAAGYCYLICSEHLSTVLQFNIFRFRFNLFNFHCNKGSAENSWNFNTFQLLGVTHQYIQSDAWPRCCCSRTHGYQSCTCRMYYVSCMSSILLLSCTVLIYSSSLYIY